MDIIADEETKYQFVIDVASGVKRYDDILIWLEDYVEYKTAATIILNASLHTSN